MPIAPRGPRKTVRRGRRPKGTGDPRRAILSASLREFARRGYDRATLRAIAKDARVDPALVYHYFGSKEGLFLESMGALMVHPSEAELPSTEPAELQARRVVGLFLSRWGGGEEPTPLIALLRSAASDPNAAALLRRLFAQQVTPQVSRYLPREDAELRIALIGSALFGVALLRHIVRLEPLASATPEDVGRWVGPVLTRYMSDQL